MCSTLLAMKRCRIVRKGVEMALPDGNCVNTDSPSESDALGSGFLKHTEFAGAEVS